MIPAKYIEELKKFEGFRARPYWDYRQWTNGYGTKALSKSEIITRAEATRRLEARLAQIEHQLDQKFPGLAAGTKAALASLTYNIGSRWMTSSGLAAAVRSGNADAIRARMRLYNKAGGKVLASLVKRRGTEASWVGKTEVA